MNDTNNTLRIAELREQGYKEVSLRGLDYIPNFSEQEKKYTARFFKDTMRGSMIMLITMIITAVFPIVIACIIPRSNPPAMKFIVVGFIALVSVAMIILIMVRAFGPKKVTRGVVAAKNWRMTRGKGSARPVYFVVVYQSFPNKVYVKNVQVYKDAFDEISGGDNVVIIKSLVGGTAYKE